MTDGVRTDAQAARSWRSRSTGRRPMRSICATSRRLERRVQRVPRRPGAAHRDHHRRRRAILLPRLGPQGRRGRREIRRGLGRRRLRRPQLSAQPRQADHRGGQRHRLRRRLRDRARHRHHRHGGARAVRAARDQRRRRCRTPARIKLRRRIPYHVAVEFLLTGRWMDAAEAKHWGLANHVVPKGQAHGQGARDRAAARRRAAAAVSGHQAAAAAHRDGARARRLSSCTIRSTRCSR